MAATIGNLFINLKANSAPLQAGLKKSQGAVSSFSNGVKKSFRALTSFRTLVIGAGLAASVALGKRAADAIDKTSKAASKLGMTTNELIAMRHASEMSGVGVETFDMAMQRMIRRVSEASHGFGEAKGALQELGLDAGQLAQLPVSEQMAKITSAMEGVELQADKVRLAMKLFDSEGVSLVNMMARGEDGLRSMMNEASELGLTFSSTGAAGVASMNDSLKKLGSVLTSSVHHVLIAIAPALQKVVSGMLEWVKEMGGAGRIGMAVFSGIAKGVAWVLDAVQALTHGFRAIVSAVRWVASQVMYYFNEVIIEAIAVAAEILDDDWGKAARNAQEDIRAIALEMERAAESDFNQVLDDSLAESWGDKAERFADELQRTWEEGNKAAETIDHVAKAQENLQAATAGSTSEVEKFVEQLDKQIRTFGMTSEMAKLTELERAGADPKFLAMARARIKALESMRASADKTAAVTPAGPTVETGTVSASVETAIGAASFAFGTEKKVQEEQLKEAEEQTSGIKQLVDLTKNVAETLGDVFDGVLE